MERAQGDDPYLITFVPTYPIPQAHRVRTRPPMSLRSLPPFLPPPPPPKKKPKEKEKQKMDSYFLRLTRRQYDETYKLALMFGFELPRIGIVEVEKAYRCMRAEKAKTR